MNTHLTLNNFPVVLRKINNVDCFRYKDVLFAYGVFNPQSNELKKIEPSNIIKKIGRGRNSCTYITSLGLSQWINHSIKFPPHIKRAFIKELIDNNIVPVETAAYSSTKETVFISNLMEFLNEIGSFKIQMQHIINGYIVDVLINNKFVVEFDENKHISYDKKYEGVREMSIKMSGYVVIRVTDEMSVGKALGLILNGIKL